MTILRFTSSIKTARLSLKIFHFLTPQQTPLPLDPADEAYKVIKASDLRGIQIFPPPCRLVITIEGNVDGSAVCAEQIRHSAVGKHLLKCLRKNSETLSIHDISDMVIENNKATSTSLGFSINTQRLALTGAPVYFSSSHAYSDGPNSPHLLFLSFNLIYTWTSDTTEREGLNCETNLACNFPFNPIASSRVSPFVELLDKIGHGLLSRHIIRRYPWTFGPYSQAIRKEQTFFPLMAKSLCSIIGRSRNQLLRSKFLAEVEKMRQKNALHDQLSYQHINDIIHEDSPDRNVIGNNVNDQGTEEQDRPFAPVLEQCLTNLYGKGVKPWIKGLHGYFDSSDRSASISAALDPAFGDLPTPLDLPNNGSDETPELDWSSSPESDIDSVEFEFMQDSDVNDEDDVITLFPDTCKDFEIANMSSDRNTSEALFDESAGNLANQDECLENIKEDMVLIQQTFTPRDNTSLTARDVQAHMDGHLKPNLSSKELFLQRVINKVHEADEEPNWSEMDMEDSSDDSSQFEPSEKRGSLLSCGQVGQDFFVHVNNVFYCESDSETEWDLVHSQPVDF